MRFLIGLILILAFTQASLLGVKTTTVRKTTSKARAVKSSKARARKYYSPWREPTYADSTTGDHIDGEDLEVRRAAVAALGPLNGTVVVVEAQTGRVLSIVNQKVALKGGFTPCSTVKIYIGMAGLSEGIVERETPVRLTRRLSLNMTEALAKSDNVYFAKLGQQLGFDRVSYYGKLFGLGERATLGFDGEIPGTLPATTPADGVGMMSSFGHGIKLTPLQLASTLSAIANGGTLFYLQYPQTREDAENFIPRVKRHLDIGQFIPEIKPGMMAAVESGTARRAGYDPDLPILGKTGTCTDTSTPTHLGWFGSISDNERNRLAVVVLLTGGKPINGPVASGVAGQVYKKLHEVRWFDKDRPMSPVALVR
jgi:cell division protein FtsI/penicillin-binding protein 2